MMYSDPSSAVNDGEMTGGMKKLLAPSMIFNYAQSKQVVDLSAFPKQRDVQQMFRNQKIALKFILYQKDKAGFDEVQPYYVSVSAILTPYKLLEELHSYFTDFAQKAMRRENEVWLEMNGNAIPWTMPLSAAIDMFTNDDTPIPYTIVLHFRNPSADFEKIENLSQLKQQIKTGLKSTGLVLYNRADVVKSNLGQTEHDKMWNYLMKDEINDYFTIYDKVMNCSFNFNKNEMRIPITFYVKGTSHEISRGVMACLQLGEVLESMFPQLHDPSTHMILPKFEHAQIKLMGYDLQFCTPIYYLYETFKSTTGVLFLTLVL